MKLEMVFEQKFNNLKVIDKGAEFESCVFHNCNFANSDLLSVVFEECQFYDCDFSNAKIANTSFKNVLFKGCKLIGLHFENCNPLLLSFKFENCQLNFSSFYELNINKTKFNKCELKDVDFTDTKLTESIFTNCDLKNSVFDNTNIEKVDFRTSYNYSINPSNNKLRNAKFSKNEVQGLLTQFNIIIE